jgi:CheY-like chemotaxis protein
VCPATFAPPAPVSAPVAATPPPGGDGPTQQGGAPQLPRKSALPSQLRVLLVEDDDLIVLVMRASISMGLKKLYGTTAHIQRARTAEEALEMVHASEGESGGGGGGGGGSGSGSGGGGDGGGKTCAFDMLVVDQHMEPAGGVMKGAQLVEIMNARPYEALQKPVLVIASGNADTEAGVAEFKAAGAALVWAKPYPKGVQLASEVAGAFEARADADAAVTNRVDLVVEQPLDAVDARVPTAPLPTAGARSHRLGSRCCFDMVPKPHHCACPLASDAAPPDPLFCGWFRDADTGRKEFRVLERTPLATRSFHDADLSQFQKTRSAMIAKRDVTYCRLATVLYVRSLARD